MSALYYAFPIASTRVSQPTTPADKTTDVGPKDSKFSGCVLWVQIDIDEAAEDLDHLITPEERLRVAMARQ